MSAYIVYIPYPSLREAKTAAKSILNKRLAACCNIIPKVHSYYWWKGKLQQDSEAVVICKTLSGKVTALEKHVKETHPYSIPFIGRIKLAHVNASYRKWLSHELKVRR
jgi:periplasmic divalent cation tolerance protein